MKENKKKSDLKKGLFFIIVFLMSITLLSFIYENSGIDKYISTISKSDKDEIIACIDGDPIKFNSMDNKIDSIIYYKDNIKGLKEARNTAADYKSAVKFIVAEEVLYREGRSVGIRASQNEISEYYRNVIKNIEKEFNTDGNKLLKENGISIKDLKQNLEKNIIVYKYLQKKTDFSDSEIREYYDNNIEEFREYRYLNILIDKEYMNGENKKVTRSSEEAKEIAVKILNKINKDGNFEKIGKYYEKRIEGVRLIDMGYINPEDLDGEVDEKLLAMKAGEFPDEPVENRYGYNIPMKIDSRYTEFSDVRESIKEELVYKKQLEIIKQLNSKYNVVIKDEYK